MTANNQNLVRYSGLISLSDRNRLNGHRSGVIWFTGLPASGKSTIAHLLELELYQLGIRSYVLDGDNLRHGLNSDLGFSREDRMENIRRAVEVARLFADAGLIVMCAFITPFEEERRYIRERLRDLNLVEVYVKCGIEKCEERDEKGFYKRARVGILKDYTGVSSPYEEPERTDLVIDTEILTVDESVSAVLRYLREKRFLDLDM
jgi:adenylylsulfate kinase